MENLIQKAILTAMKAHEGEVRKGDGVTPYVLHPLEVGIIMSYYTYNPLPIASAILHDTVEHGKLTPEKIKEEFGEDVAAWIGLLTENKEIKDWQERKIEAVNRLKDNPAVAAIKAADALANMRDLFAAIKAQGQGVWKKFNADRELKLSYFRFIFDQLKAHLPAPLIEQYVAALKDLEYSHLLPAGEAEIGFKVKD